MLTPMNGIVYISWRLILQFFNSGQITIIVMEFLFRNRPSVYIWHNETVTHSPSHRQTVASISFNYEESFPDIQVSLSGS